MKRRIVSLLLALVMALTLTLPAYADGEGAATNTVTGNVSYMNWDSDQKKLVKEDKANLEYTVVEDSATNVTWGAENTTTYYVVNDTKVISNTVTVYGDVHLILCDNATLTVNGGVVVDGGNDNKSGKLTIYGQSEGTGALVAKGSNSAGINIDSYSPLTINGGDTTDEANVRESYGIHGTYVVINGGKVIATGGAAKASTQDDTGNAPAISGGINVYGVTVNGGEVTATGGTATGASCKSFGIDSALTVNGGKVEAKGGTATETATETATATATDEDTSAQAESYGICTGENIDIVVKGGTVNATGGTAKATGEDACAYSYGIYARNNMTVDGGEVNATGGTAEAAGEEAYAESCGIYVCHYDWDKETYYGKLTIKGGTVNATVEAAAEATGEDAYAYSYGIFVAEDMTVKGGSTTVNATGGVANGHFAYSYGICAWNDIDVKGGVVKAYGGKGEAAGELSEVYSYGIYAYNGVTIKNAWVTAEGKEANGYYTHSFGIYTEDDITFENATIRAEGKTANGAYTAYSYGICAYYNGDYSNLTIKNANITATGKTAKVENAGEGTDAKSYGIFVAKDMIVEGERTTVNATGGTASSKGDDAGSYGICVNKNLTIEDGEVTAKGGEAEAGSWVYSYGIYVGDKLTINGGTVTGTGQDATGESAESWGICGKCELIITGGTVIAETTASNAECHKLALLCDTSKYELPDTYWWRTAKSGAYSQFPSTPYVYNSADTYVKITTTTQTTGGDSGDDDETLKPPTEDTDPGTGHKRYYTSNQNADAKSADTYDAGIAAYVVMGGISTVTSAAWLRRRKK